MHETQTTAAFASRLCKYLTTYHVSAVDTKLSSLQWHVNAEIKTKVECCELEMDGWWSVMADGERESVSHSVTGRQKLNKPCVCVCVWPDTTRNTAFI